MTDTKQKASVFKIWWSVNIDNEDLRRFDMHSDTFYSIFDRSIFRKNFKFKGA